MWEATWRYVELQGNRLLHKLWSLKMLFLETKQVFGKSHV